MGIAIERSDDGFQAKGSENCQNSGKKKMLHLCPGSILLANSFRNFSEKIFLEKTAIRNCIKETADSAKIAKVARICVVM